MTPSAKDIVDHCKHLLQGACGSCIETAIQGIAYEATVRHAQGEAHICLNQKLKPYGELLCASGCGQRPSTWLRDVVMRHAGRVEGYRRGVADAAKAVPVELRAIVLDREPPADWAEDV